MSNRVLVVEDEMDIRELIQLHLEREGLRADGAADGQAALERIQRENYDLFVLDWMLPNFNGLELIREIRERKREATPILMVTARLDSSDVVLGLEAGADDYVTKPFSVPVLMARVRALLRRDRIAGQESKNEKIRIGELTIDLAAHEVHASGEPVALTASEFKIVASLAQSQGRVLTRDHLIDLARGTDVTVVGRAIDTHVFGIRKKLGGCSGLIETVRGVGYRMNRPKSA